jgi:hypothetical protein
MPASMTSTIKDNRILLEMIPDLIDQEHVQIAPSVMVLYYVLLYHGCCLPDYTGVHLTMNNSMVYMERAYLLALRSLPAWQRSAIGSSLDLSTAVLMVIVTSIFMLLHLANEIRHELQWKRTTST